MDADDRPPTPQSVDAPLTPDEIAPLLKNLAGADSELRNATLSALVTLSLSTDAWLAVSNSLEPLLQAESTSDSDLLVAAVNVPTLRIRGLLHSRAESIEEPAVRRELVLALARARDRAAIPPLLEDLRGDDVYVQSAAVEFLSFFAVPTARDEFAHLAARDPDGDTRFWSATCLAQLGEPGSLAHLLESPDATSALTFMWGDPALAFARIQGRGPWPSVTEAMLERLGGGDNTIVDALLAGYDKVTSAWPPESALPEQTSVDIGELRKRALALRDRLERTFPNELQTEDWGILAYLPDDDGASLISRLWRRLADDFAAQQRAQSSPGAPFADPWLLLGGGNALVGMAREMGSSFVPEIAPLFASYADTQDHGQCSDQIGWTIGRSGMRAVVNGLRDRLGSADNYERLPATRLVESAGVRSGNDLPPIYGGSPASAPPRQVTHFLDELVSANGGAGGSLPDEQTHAAPPDEFATGSAPPESQPTSTRPDFDLGSMSYGLPTSGAAPAAPGDGAGAAMSKPRAAGAGPEPQPVDSAQDGDSAELVTDPPRTAFPHLHCPQVVTAGEEFALEVGLAQLQDSTVQGSAIVRPAWSQGPYVLTVWVLADGFRVKAGDVLRHHLAVRVEDPYPRELIHLTPDPQGDDVVHRKIEMTYFIGSQLVGIAYREVEVVRAPELVAITPPPPVPLARTFPIPDAYTQPDLTVKISEGDDPRHLYWSFVVSATLNVETPPLPIKSFLDGNPADFAKQLIARMNRPAGSLLSLQMRGIGKSLKLVAPSEFWDILRNVAAGVGNRPPTLLILSQDPYVPWELALVDPPLDPKSAPYLGAQTVLGRWILPRLDRVEPAPPVQEPRMAGTMAVLSGAYPERGRWKRLPHAEQEAADLIARYQGRQVAADTDSVGEFLQNPPDAEVFHFAGHAVYDPESLENGLVLNDGAYLDGTVIMGARLAPEPRPFVFLNACQAGSGYDVLGGYGGLVGALVMVGASAVVAPLWSVNDEQARKVSIEFYERAVDGDERPAEILRRQRAQFGKDAEGADVDPESAIHLAYQFFGHPSMRLIRKHT